MFFSVLERNSRIPANTRSQAFLFNDNWDDWAKFATLFELLYVDIDGNHHDVGGVKIGAFDMVDEYRTKVPREFDNLGERFFSLGQDASYYETLNKLSPIIRNKILNALRDVAADEDLFSRALAEKVTKISLLRFVTPVTVRGQFRRLAKGGCKLSPYKFTYETAANRIIRSSVPFTFDVVPESEPPTNIHVIIGRNGVGKTHILNDMAEALLGDPIATERFQFPESEEENESARFANLVSVTFSAFDEFEPRTETRDRTAGIHYSYIGLKPTRTESTAPKSPTSLKGEFVKSLRACSKGPRASRWQNAIKALEADPIFKEADVSAILAYANDDDDDKELRAAAALLFGRLSSGHKIVLLTITRLVEAVEERTLILMDEPEAHLHPPLLSAFINALSELLMNRNGVAIIATHSPVVLQEVPKSCVWKLHRSGSVLRAERPERETFGENVGVLTREVFSFEVTHSGFYKAIGEAVTQENHYEDLLRRFENNLGDEAQAIARALFAIREI